VTQLISEYGQEQFNLIELNNKLIAKDFSRYHHAKYDQ